MDLPNINFSFIRDSWPKGWESSSSTLQNLALKVGALGLAVIGIRWISPKIYGYIASTRLVIGLSNYLDIWVATSEKAKNVVIPPPVEEEEEESSDHPPSNSVRAGNIVERVLTLAEKTLEKAETIITPPEVHAKEKDEEDENSTPSLADQAKRLAESTLVLGGRVLDLGNTVVKKAERIVTPPADEGRGESENPPPPLADQAKHLGNGAIALGERVLALGDTVLGQAERIVTPPSLTNLTSPSIEPRRALDNLDQMVANVTFSDLSERANEKEKQEVENRSQTTLLPSSEASSSNPKPQTTIIENVQSTLGSVAQSTKKVEETLTSLEENIVAVRTHMEPVIQTGRFITGVLGYPAMTATNPGWLFSPPSQVEQTAVEEAAALENRRVPHPLETRVKQIHRIAVSRAEIFVTQRLALTILSSYVWYGILWGIFSRVMF